MIGLIICSRTMAPCRTPDMRAPFGGCGKWATAIDRAERAEDKEIRVGDTLKVWWGKHTATVVRIGPHASGQEGWRVLYFGDGHSMTQTPLDRLEKLCAPTN